MPYSYINRIIESDRSLPFEVEGKPIKQASNANCELAGLPNSKRARGGRRVSPLLLDLPQNLFFHADETLALQGRVRGRLFTFAGAGPRESEGFTAHKVVLVLTFEVDYDRIQVGQLNMADLLSEAGGDGEWRTSLPRRNFKQRITAERTGPRPDRGQAQLRPRHVQQRQ